MKPLGDTDLDQVFSDIRELARPQAADRRRVSDALRARLGPEVVPHGIEALASSAAPAQDRAARAATLARDSAALGGVAHASRRAYWISTVVGTAILMGTAGLIVGYGWGRAERLGAPPPAPSAVNAAASGAVSDGVASQLEPARVGTLPGPATSSHASTDPASSQVGGASSTALRRSTSSVTELPSSNRAAPPGARGRAAERAVTASASLTFAEAVERLRKANMALQANNPSLALLQLAELDRVAGETLREEREVTRILTHCALGNRLEARRIARSFRFDEGGSIYARRIAQSCAGRDPLD